jgi:hypothetical protein
MMAICVQVRFNTSIIISLLLSDELIQRVVDAPPLTGHCQRNALLDLLPSHQSGARCPDLIDGADLFSWV